MIRTPHRLPALLLATAATLLGGCSNDSAGPGEIRVIEGQAVKGPVSGATIRAFRVGGAGQAEGPSLASALTDANGQFQLSVPAGEALLITSSGGSFLDEADELRRRRFQLGPDQGLAAILPADAQTASLTPLTDSIVRRARRFAAGVRFEQAYEQALEQAVAAYGFDPVTTLAPNPVAPGTASGAQLDYAVLLGGFAHLLNAASQRAGLARPNYEILEALMEDLGDGLDGRADGEPIDIDIGSAKGILASDLDYAAEMQRHINNNPGLFGAPPLIGAFGTITVGNAAPVANDDSFNILRGGRLEVSAPGVVENDVDSDGDSPLQVELVDPPAHAASFQLREDGSFSYRHDGSEGAGDSFTYRIDDGFGVAKVASAPATVTIAINDLPNFRIGDAVRDEDAGSMSFEVVREISTDGSASVEFATVDDTATAAADYTATSGTLVFADGQESALIEVPILDDSVFEGDETFFVNLFSPSTGSIVGMRGIGTILDNESAPRFGVTGSSGDEDDGPLSITVTLTGATALTSRVTLSTVDGTATAPSDYASIGGFRLSFAPGVTTQTFAVAIVADSEIEPDETFTAMLSAPENAEVEGGSANLAIINDDFNTAPRALDEDFRVDQDEQLRATLMAEDDEDDVLTFRIVNEPNNGSLSLNSTNGNFTYTPNAGFSGNDSFEFVANDGEFDSNVAIIDIDVTPNAPRDTDNDGVPDGSDQCAATPPETPVDPNGCPSMPGDRYGPGAGEGVWNNSYWGSTPQ